MLDLVDDLYQQGLKLHKSGKVELACQVYNLVLNANPEHSMANHNMGALAVDIGKVQEALPFFEAALEANADVAQFWVSYIDALINVERIADAQAVFGQAKSNGAKGDGFDKLEQRLNEAGQEPLKGKQVASEPQLKQPNILDTLKLDQAISLAKKKAKDGSPEEAKRIYQDILTKFPKNKRASDGLKGLVGRPVGKASKVQEPPQAQTQALINLYSQGQLQQALQEAGTLVQQFPQSAILFNIQGAVLKGLGQLDASVEAYNKALTIKPDNAEAYNNMGITLKDQGKLEEAIEAYNKALTIKPDNAGAYSNMGNALKEQGKLEKAIEAYNKALDIKPDNAEAYYNMGLSLQEQGKLEEAIEAYKKSLAIKPDNSDAYYNMGNALQEQNKLEEAIEAYNKALTIKPDDADAYYNMGVTLRGQGKLEEAIEAYNKALDIKPDHAEAYKNMGVTLQDQGKLEEAIEAYNKAIIIKPDNAEAYYNMGIVLKDQGKLEEAIQAYKKALAIKPDYAEAYGNMGTALADQGKLEEAIEAYNKALNIKPDCAEVYSNLGVVLKDQGKPVEAIDAYNKALAIKPDYAEVHRNLGLEFLKIGRISEGFEEYEWRWKTKDISKIQRHFSQPLWDGRKSLKGKKILLWCEQGVGDTINWSYCLPFIASQAEHCILECQEKLVPLLARSFPNVEVKHENRSLDAERYDFDYHLPMGSLYRHCITKLPLDFNVDAYLVPDPVRVNFWRKRLHSIGKGPYVGISWKSANMGSSRLPNYASISDLSPILTLPDITFINLQYIDFEDDLAKIQKDLGVIVHNFDDLDHYDNLDEVAALSAALDVVVSVQSAVPIITAGVGTCTKLASWRQSSFNSILNSPLGPSLDKFFCDTWEPWDGIFSLISQRITTKFDLKS